MKTITDIRGSNDKGAVMAKDPICGMTVSETTALRAERDGQTHYFCSEHCREKFIGEVRSATVIPLTPSGPTSGCCGGGKPVSSSGGCCGGKPSDAAHDHGHHGHSHHQHSAAAVKPSSAAKYFCPMCPGVESDEPGDCPKCGMALERNPAWVAPAVGKVIYTCPMHPEVQQDHPGDCPKCGMALEPKTISAAPD
jgi:Cu+-exporting ATPase